ncbi:STAS domain-containing protein [Modestobacter versicolor]|uniref:STAS domain-containing protein n=1 Tax=Modestobacter versicolor TaxID=429133 RepID=UPI0034DFF627
MTALPADLGPDSGPDPGVDPGVDLDVLTTAGPHGCTVRVRGELDTRGAPVLVDRVLDVLQLPGVPVVELDLRQVTFLGSAGLTALVTVHRAAGGAGRVLQMRCGTSRAVLRPLEITDLTSVFTVVDGPGGSPVG